MGFPCDVGIQSLQIHRPSQVPILLFAGHYPMAPRNRISHRYWLEDSSTNISVQPCFDLLLPVQRDWYWGMYCNWMDIMIYIKRQRWTLHQWQLLVFTDVECAGAVVFNNPFFNVFAIFLCCRVPSWGQVEVMFVWDTYILLSQCLN